MNCHLCDRELEISKQSAITTHYICKCGTSKIRENLLRVNNAPEDVYIIYFYLDRYKITFDSPENVLHIADSMMVGNERVFNPYHNLADINLSDIGKIDSSIEDKIDNYLLLK